MIQNPVSIQALRVGEVLTLALGFGMSTLAVLARVYTKTRLTRKMMMEDCEFASLVSPKFQATFCSN